MKLFFKISLFALAAFSPAKMFACAACGSGSTQMIDSPMVDGMNLGILTLLVVLVIVLAAALTFLVCIIRKSEVVEAARKQKIEAGNSF